MALQIQPERPKEYVRQGYFDFEEKFIETGKSAVSGKSCSSDPASFGKSCEVTYAQEARAESPRTVTVSNRANLRDEPDDTIF